MLGLVLQRGTGLILLGTALGGVGAYGVSRVLVSMIPTLPARDPATAIALGIALAPTPTLDLEHSSAVAELLRWH